MQNNNAGGSYQNDNYTQMQQPNYSQPQQQYSQPQTNQNNYQQNNYNQPQSQVAKKEMPQVEEIPEIDIDEDEIPF
jgi:hypothetical protein